MSAADRGGGEVLDSYIFARAGRYKLLGLIIPNAKGSSLDPSSDQSNLLTTKVGIDATATLLKAKERFEIARIPGEENTDLRGYLQSRD